MKKLAASLAISLVAAPSLAGAQAGAPASRCAALANDWKYGEMDLAENKAAGLSDDSAPRATMRATQDLATYSRASLILKLMEANRCPLPARPPEAINFLGAAMDCRLARMKATLEQAKAGIAACDRTKWTAGVVSPAQ